MTPQDFQKATAASDDLMNSLYIYEKELYKWQKRSNLVSSSTLPDLWGRHFYDSMQLANYLPLNGEEISDIGTGAGFPGMVLAVLGVPNITLIEKNSKKVEFLKRLKTLIKPKVKIVNKRIDKAQTLKSDIVISRALAPLPELLRLCTFILKADGYIIVLKGKSFFRELTEAKKTWIMEVEHFQSRSDSSGVILKINNLRLRKYDKAYIA
ncbi:MAG: Ribosomal RNA small subunit methyltransferase G [Alphaproteobacteria bacterium MarineAlpha3_Bin5]|nr:16S rRNA (guanine(527)-N(7))-methyltransferase RsmG [Magnetovibrio sp.]PPR80181.1 MAG: Ribosomal RNA small subunit methyltransferase G [Alphaproteobacteria bacterium MarineAlpha3_Bin5]